MGSSVHGSCEIRSLLGSRVKDTTCVVPVWVVVSSVEFEVVLVDGFPPVEYLE